jgi:hypothetical protein
LSLISPRIQTMNRPSPALKGTLVLALQKYLKRKAAARSEATMREELLKAMLALKDERHADHLALLEKLDANHRELLAALDRQATRINTLEAGLARVDERTK